MKVEIDTTHGVVDRLQKLSQFFPFLCHIIYKMTSQLLPARGGVYFPGLWAWLSWWFALVNAEWRRWNCAGSELKPQEDLQLPLFLSLFPLPSPSLSLPFSLFISDSCDCRISNSGLACRRRRDLWPSHFCHSCWLPANCQTGQHESILDPPAPSSPACCQQTRELDKLRSAEPGPEQLNHPAACRLVGK